MQSCKVQILVRVYFMENIMTIIGLVGIFIILEVIIWLFMRGQDNDQDRR